MPGKCCSVGLKVVKSARPPIVLSASRTSKYCPQVVPRLEKPKGGRRQVMMAGPGGGKGRE